MGREERGAKVGVGEAPCAHRTSSQRASSWARLRGSVTARLMCVLKGGVRVLGVAGLGRTGLCDASHGEAGDSLPSPGCPATLRAQLVNKSATVIWAREKDREKRGLLRPPPVSCRPQILPSELHTGPILFITQNLPHLWLETFLHPISEFFFSGKF